MCKKVTKIASQNVLMGKFARMICVKLSDGGAVNTKSCENNIYYCSDKAVIHYKETFSF